MIGRLYFDEDSSDEVVAHALRASDVDLLTVADSGLYRATDADQLAFAFQSGRTILTANVSDFARLHREYLQNDRHHAGILIRKQRRGDTGEQIRRLISFASEVDPREMADRLEFLTRWG